MTSGTMPSHFTIAAIQAATCVFYNEAPKALRGPSRHRLIAHRRQMAMTLCRRLTDNSYPVIGRAFGNRDHTIVMHAVRAVELRQAADPTLVIDLDAITDIAQRLSEQHRALGASFLLSRIEAAEAVGCFAAAFGEYLPVVSAAPPISERESWLREAWKRQIAAVGPASVGETE